MSKASKFGLVDPVRTAKVYIEQLKARNIDFVVIDSGLLPIEQQPVAGYPFIAKQQTIEQTAELICQHGIDMLIPCVDPSIVYTDELSALCGLPFNGTLHSLARRDKAHMIARVAACGVRTPHSLETQDFDSLQSWVSQNGLPVVVKPTGSGGSDNVHLCHTLEEVARAFDSILNRNNLLGGINHSVLAQEYVDGDEYAIDCVSYDSCHVLADCYRYQKGLHNGCAFVYEKEHYLSAQDSTTGKLFSVAQQVLDALGFRYGPSHMELKINSVGEIVFIEVGARLSGGDTHLLTADLRADGQSQVSMSLDAYQGLTAPDSNYQSAAFGSRTYVIAEQQGILQGFHFLDEIVSLASFRRTQLSVKPGDEVILTTDMSTDIGWFDLAHQSQAIFNQDQQTLDALIARGILELVQP